MCQLDWTMGYSHTYTFTHLHPVGLFLWKNPNTSWLRTTVLDDCYWRRSSREQIGKKEKSKARNFWEKCRYYLSFQKWWLDCGCQELDSLVHFCITHPKCYLAQTTYLDTRKVCGRYYYKIRTHSVSWDSKRCLWSSHINLFVIKYIKSTVFLPYKTF